MFSNFWFPIGSINVPGRTNGREIQHPRKSVFSKITINFSRQSMRGIHIWRRRMLSRKRAGKISLMLCWLFNNFILSSFRIAAEPMLLKILPQENARQKQVKWRRRQKTHIQMTSRTLFMRLLGQAMNRRKDNRIRKGKRSTTTNEISKQKLSTWPSVVERGHGRGC